ncbi:hypothetical protein C8Q76DRAFT_167 [Earliella scabrosa]|nr:hypothetical protein C8Q76DRAFT_167 [Earliella scabrosa]
MAANSAKMNMSEPSGVSSVIDPSPQLITGTSESDGVHITQAVPSNVTSTNMNESESSVPATTSLTLSTAFLKVEHGMEDSITADLTSTDTNVLGASTPIATSTAVASSRHGNPIEALPSDDTDTNSNSDSN